MIDWNYEDNICAVELSSEVSDPDFASLVETMPEEDAE